MLRKRVALGDSFGNDDSSMTTLSDDWLRSRDRRRKRRGGERETPWGGCPWDFEARPLGWENHFKDRSAFLSSRGGCLRLTKVVIIFNIHVGAGL